MISGAHVILYSTNPEADRAFFRDVLKLDYVDAGDGWLIFGLPPAEVAVHPAGENGGQELYLLCDDIETFVKGMIALNLQCSPIQKQTWGLLTRISLPGGSQLGIYQPRHARPDQAGSAKGKQT